MDDENGRALTKSLYSSALGMGTMNPGYDKPIMLFAWLVFS